MLVSPLAKKRRKALTGSSKPGSLGAFQVRDDAEADFASILASMRDSLAGLESADPAFAPKTKEQIVHELAYAIARVPWWLHVEDALLKNMDGLKITFRVDRIFREDIRFCSERLAPLVKKALRYTGLLHSGRMFGADKHLFFSFSIRFPGVTTTAPRLQQVKIEPYTNVTRLQALCLVLLVCKARAFPKAVYQSFSFRTLTPYTQEFVRSHEDICAAFRILARLPSSLCRYAIEFL